MMLKMLLLLIRKIKDYLAGYSQSPRFWSRLGQMAPGIPLLGSQLSIEQLAADNGWLTADTTSISFIEPLILKT